jgi:hypothetical protein
VGPLVTRPRCQVAIWSRHRIRVLPSEFTSGGQEGSWTEVAPVQDPSSPSTPEGSVTVARETWAGRNATLLVDPTLRSASLSDIARFVQKRISAHRCAAQDGGLGATVDPEA